MAKETWWHGQKWVKGVSMVSGDSLPTLSTSYFIMPHDNLNRYYMPGGYGQHTITRMSRMAYAHSANSTAMYTRLYATADSLIQRIDQQGEDWYHDEANDLHLHNFIWYAQMQTAQRMWDWGTRVRNID